MLLVSRPELAYHHGNLAPTLEDAALELMRARAHLTQPARSGARRWSQSQRAASPLRRWRARDHTVRVGLAELLVAGHISRDEIEPGQRISAGRGLYTGAI